MAHNIEHIVYINLKRRYDRRVAFERMMDDMKLPYERFDAIENKHAYLGCCYSHLAVLKMARDRGYKNILIFEDDFEFEVTREELDKRLDFFFTKCGSFYEVLMLSANIYNSRNLEFAHPDPNIKIKQVLYAKTASGYLVSGDYLPKLIQLYEWAFSILSITGEHWMYMNDTIWRSLQYTGLWYYIYPRIGKQRACYSDLAGDYRDYGV